MLPTTIYLNSDKLRKGKKNKNIDAPVLVGIPFVFYKIQMVGRSINRNIFNTTIVALEKELSKTITDHGRVIDYISEKLDLNRIFVKTILKNHKNNCDENNPNGSYNSPEVGYFYIMYNKLSKEYSYYTLPEKLFLSNTALECTINEGDEEIKIKQNLGSSENDTVLLFPDKAGGDIAGLMSTEDVVKIIANTEASQFLDDGYKFEATNIAREVLVVTEVVYTQDDLSMFKVINTFKESSRDYRFNNELALQLKLFLEENPDHPANNALLKVRIKQQQRIEKKLKNPENRDKEFIEELKRVYGSIYNCYTTLFERLVSLEKNYVTLNKLIVKADNSNITESEKEKKENYKSGFAVSYCNFLESLIFHLFTSNLQHEHILEINKRVANIKKFKKADAYADLVTDIGFNCDEDSKKFLSKANTESISYIFKTANPDNNQYIQVFLLGCLLEALFDSNHPLNRLSKTDKGFIGSLNKAYRMRNYSKHDAVAKKLYTDSEIGFYHNYGINLLKVLLLGDSAKVGAVNKNIFELDPEKHEMAKGKAQLEISNHPVLKNISRAYDLSYAYAIRDKEYMSKAYNLIDTVLSEIFSETTSSEERIQAAKMFSGDNKNDGQMVHEVLRKYNVTIPDKFNPPKTAELKRYNNRNNELMSLGLKLYLMVILLDRFNPDFLSEILKRCPELVKLIYDIYAYRDHSEETNFSSSKDSYQSFHNQLLDYSSSLLVML